MSYEASKTRAIWGPDVMSLLTGQGLDIGCGPDPILPTVDRFDLEQGDANTITRYVHKQYDFVFSSHTLEHMVDPYAALEEWFALVKPGANHSSSAAYGSTMCSRSGSRRSRSGSRWSSPAGT